MGSHFKKLEDLRSMDEDGAKAASADAEVTAVTEVAPEVAQAAEDDLDARLAAAEEHIKKLDDAERAIDRAFSTGKADRAQITRTAHDDAEEAVRLVASAMEADEMADDAARMSVIAEKTNDRDKIKRARTRLRTSRQTAKKEHRAASKAAKQAYDAIRFSAPNKLGFMRVIQVFFLLHIFQTMLLMVLTSRNDISYNSSTIFDWVMIVLEGVGFWFLVNQYRIGKPYMIALGATGIIYSCIVDIMQGQFSVGQFIADTLFYLIVLLYFIFSKRVDYVMVNDFAKHEGVIEKDDFQINRKGWPFYRNLIMYFVVFSVLGHWMEAGMCQFIRLGLVEGEYDPTNTMLWRDWLYPFPMEGAAVVIIAVALYPLFKWLQKKFSNKILPYVVSFFANALVCSLIEFSMGLIVNSNYQLWDYRENFGNVMGQVCLQNAMAFGVAASVIAWFVYPLLERWIARLRPEVVNIVFVVIAVFGGILWSLYIIDPPEGATEAEIKQEQLSEEERKEKDERDALGISMAFTTTSAVRKSVDEALYLTQEERNEIKKELDIMEASRSKIMGILEKGLSASSESSSSNASSESSASEAAPEPTGENQPSESSEETTDELAPAA